jgi:hypothetical protein
MEEPRLRLARLVAGRRSKFVAIGAWIPRALHPLLGDDDRLGRAHLVALALGRRVRAKPKWILKPHD